MSRPAKPFWGGVKIGRSNNCWEWQRGCNSTGYGTVRFKGRTSVAHRVAWILSVGGTSVETPLRTGSGAKFKKFVLHKCDNRKCCNPNHLFLGSMHDNQKDAYNKQRKAQPQGHRHANSKLSKKQAAAIRRKYIRGVIRQVDLAAEYGVSQRAISLLVRGETYCG